MLRHVFFIATALCSSCAQWSSASPSIFFVNPVILDRNPVKKALPPVLIPGKIAIEFTHELQPCKDFAAILPRLSAALQIIGLTNDPVVCLPSLISEMYWVRAGEEKAALEDLEKSTKLDFNLIDHREPRLRALLHGCPYLLIIDTAGRTEVQENLFSLFYITIIGVFLAPGQTITSTTYVRAELIEARSGNFVASGDAVDTKSSWFKFNANRGQEPFRSAYLKALELLIQSLLNRSWHFR